MAGRNYIMARVITIYVLFIAWGLLILGRVVYVAVFEGEKWRAKAETLTLRMFDVESLRGDILAHDGRLLATSVPYYNIRFDPLADGLTGRYKAAFDEGIDSLALGLSQLFGDRSKAQYKAEILAARKKRNRNVLLKRQVDYNQLKVLRTFPIFRLGRNRGGLITEQEYKRIYPFGDLAHRTIGYVSKVASAVGIEGSFNAYLRGKDGRELRRKISAGDWMPIRDRLEVEPKDGLNVRTTLDVNIQDIAQTALRNQLLEKGAHHGSVIVMETRTGAVRAITSLERDASGSCREVYNYAIGESVEPGSTFKLTSYMSLLEDNFVEPDDSFDNGNATYVYRRKAYDDDGRAATRGWLTVEEAFAHSSNPAIARLMITHYTGKEKQFYNRLVDLGLSKRLGLQIAGEAMPFLQNPDTKNKALGWSAWSLSQMAIGYEVRLAPIHSLTLYNAIANDGKMVKPRFVEEVLSQSGTVMSYPAEVIKSSVCSSTTLKQLRKMMKSVVEYGTAKNIRTDAYQIAGKTGTAQIAMNAGGYGVSKRHYASFVGFFPFEEPRYSCIVTISAPSIGGTGGGVAAAPVFKAISDRILAMEESLFPRFSSRFPDQKVLEVPVSKSGSAKALKVALREMDVDFDDEADSDWVSTQSSEDEVVLKDRKLIDGLVPNVSDMGLKDALFLLESAGLRVSVKGKGRVVSQSLMPGSKLAQGSRIEIMLR